MTWFKVDDSFHAHPKVLATDADALGLWVVAGAWSSSHLTDGFIPEHALLRLLPSAEELARKLVASGLWKRARGGYRFHDWADFQPSAEDVRTMREKRAAAGRLGGMASGKSRSKAGSKTEASASGVASALASPIVEPPARPDPAHLGGRSSSATNGRAREEPPPRCPRHLDRPADGPCGACGDARRAHERWERDRASHLAGLAASPRCPRHRGQPADNCAPCRSELIGGDQ